MVPFINCFGTAPELDDEFLRRWRATSLYMRDKPGFRGLRLHKVISDSPVNRYVNYVQWDSAQQWQAAHDDGFRALVQDAPWTGHVGQLYEIVESAGVIEL
ncbi:MAG TPA: antibiotic biosynthesis monooxygenase family protein [Jatrophihabitantaceae bacterium]|nr:antibiotic biosynthesis monooxygenase family protein [Jatrophihabitantaceae bacterium]